MSLIPSRLLVTARRFVAAALVASVTLAALTLTGAPEASAATCGPAPAGKTAVVVVVDTGSSITSRCVIVAEGTRGGDVLSAAGFSMRVEGLGFVCALSGIPAQGCAQNDPSADFWSYWHATPGGNWNYSSAGAYTYRVSGRCAVQGWHYVPTTKRTAPRMDPPAMNCAIPSTPAPTTKPPAVQPAVPPAAAPKPATPPPAASPGSSAGSSANSQQPAPQDGGANPQSPGQSAQSAQPEAPEQVEASDQDAGASGDTQDPNDAAADGKADADKADDDKGDDGKGDADSADSGSESGLPGTDTELAAASETSDSESESDSGSPFGVILVVVLMTALGVALWFQRRRWSAPPEQ